MASGGFQADTEWLARAWGPAAKNFLIRGTPYNRGLVLADLLAQGAESVGDPTQCHAVAIDGRAPKFDGGIVTRLDCVPFSIVVNKDAARFYDEGEDVWPKRYAIWGHLVAAQPDQVGYVIIDAKSLELFMPSVFPPLKADTLEELAQMVDLSPEKLVQTVGKFNAACGDTSNFHPTELDGVGTTGIAPPKTNWARPITEPPFYGYSLRTGVTFTYLGFKVDDHAQCRTPSGPITNLWAAGETIAGSILGQGYLAGFGMTIGTVFLDVSQAGRPQNMQTDLIQEARRQAEICNACRYCEGYCSVFPSLHANRAFADGDITQLANLCHNCRLSAWPSGCGGTGGMLAAARLR